MPWRHRTSRLSGGNKLIAPKVDIKADAGYVAAPPSIHETGRCYHWIDHSEIADLPPALLEWLRGDAVMLKFLRLGSWPCRKVFSKALAGMSDAALERLRQLVTRVGLRSVTRDTPVVLDFDGSSIVSFGHSAGHSFDLL